MGVGEGGDFVPVTDGNEPNPWFTHQHDARMQDKLLVLFDNGSARCQGGPGVCHSRDQAWQIHEGSREAELVLDADSACIPKLSLLCRARCRGVAEPILEASPNTLDHGGCHGTDDTLTIVPRHVPGIPLETALPEPPRTGMALGDTRVYMVVREDMIHLDDTARHIILLRDRTGRDRHRRSIVFERVVAELVDGEGYTSGYGTVYLESGGCVQYCFEGRISGGQPRMGGRA